MASSQPKKDDKPAPSNEAKPEEAQQKSAAALEEDDEFEDFPVEGTRQLPLTAPLCRYLRARTWLTTEQTGP